MQVLHKRVRSTPPSHSKVAITQPYIPAYRIALWEDVIQTLADNGIEARVFYGGDKHQVAMRSRRGDGTTPRWSNQVKTYTIGGFGGLPRVQIRRLPRQWRKRSVLLVTEMQASNLNAWLALVKHQRCITLGHGLSGTTDQTGLGSRLEAVMNRFADHVLTYTEAGREHVINNTNRSPSTVTAFRNSTDTDTLATALSNVQDTDTQAFRASHGIPRGARVALYLGAINRHKKIGLLVDAANLVFAKDPSHWLVVVGDGEDSAAISDLVVSTGRVINLGQAKAEDFAVAARCSSLVVNPGRIGLLAVDALAMQLPIVTTKSAMHGPEFEYLRQGVDVFVAGDTAEAFAAAWARNYTRPNTQQEQIPTAQYAAGVISRTIMVTLQHRAGLRT